MNDTTNSAGRPLRLLALDGGGIRGYSELIILDRIMTTMAYDLGLNPETIRPCDYFDLIGGTSTGGIIAILLGRLKLTVAQCIDIYDEIAELVFGQERRFNLLGLLYSRFDHNKLTGLVKQILNKFEPKMGEEAPLLDSEARCGLAFVCATPGNQVERNKPTLFRTYTSRSGSVECKIWEAVRATSAAPTFFDSIKIGGTEYVDGGLGCNNPCEQVYEEAQRIWPGREIGCIISLGTGMPRTQAISQSPSIWTKEAWTGVLEVLMRVATECDQVHQRMMRRDDIRGRGIYFRFNVRQGMQGISLQQYELLNKVNIYTESYLRDADVEPMLNDAVEKLKHISILAASTSSDK